MNEFHIKQNDTRPSLEVQLYDGNGETRDLSTADTVRFHMKKVNTQELVVDKEASILDENDGKVVYVWDEEDTSQTGSHVAEFEVVYSSDSNETFPNSGHINVYVDEDIA